MAQWWLKQISASNTLVTVTSNASDPLVIAGPYSTESAADKAAAKVNAAGGAGADLGTILGTLPGAVSAGANAGPQLTWIYAIGDFFSRLEQASTWERIGLGVAGMMLLGIGIISVAGSTETGKKAGKLAAKGLFA